MADAEEKKFQNTISRFMKERIKQLSSWTKGLPGRGKEKAQDLGEQAKQRVKDQFVETDEKGNVKIRRPGSNGIKWILVLIGVGFVAWLVMFFGPVNSLVLGQLDSLRPIWNQQIGGVPLADMGKYLGCVWENSIFFKFGDLVSNPGNIGLGTGATNPLDYCKQDLAAAQDIGCTDCFTLASETLTFKINAGSGEEGLVAAKISATEDSYCYNDIFGKQSCQPIPAAQDGTFIFLGDDGTEAAIESNLDVGTQTNSTTIEGMELDPSLLKSTPITILGRFSGDVCGQNLAAIQPSAVLKYTYRTEGQAPINIRKQSSNGAFQSVNNPISLVGPLKLDILPDSSSSGYVYNADLGFKSAFVFLKFRNAGTGAALVRSLTIEQIPPEGVTALTLKNCTSTNVERFLPDGAGGGTMFFKGLGFLLNPSDRSAAVTCTFDLTQAKSLPSDLSTFIITGSATYEYQVKAKGNSIIVDQKACEGTTSSTASGAAGSSSSSSSGSGSSGSSPSGSSPATCVLPDEDKVCANGKQMDEHGCCGV